MTLDLIQSILAVAAVLLLTVYFGGLMNGWGGKL